MTVLPEPTPDMTPDGASAGAEPSAAIECRRTDCLYPSFEQVEVTVFPHKGGYRVSDYGGAARSAWMHGVETAAARPLIRDAAILYGAEIEDLTIYADAPSEAWVHSAVLAVANASARAAYDALADARRRHRDRSCRRSGRPPE